MSFLGTLNFFQDLPEGPCRETGIWLPHLDGVEDARSPDAHYHSFKSHPPLLSLPLIHLSPLLKSPVPHHTSGGSCQSLMDDLVKVSENDLKKASWTMTRKKTPDGKRNGAHLDFWNDFDLDPKLNQEKAPEKYGVGYKHEYHSLGGPAKLDWSMP